MDIVGKIQTAWFGTYPQERQGFIDVQMRVYNCIDNAVQ